VARAIDHIVLCVGDLEGARACYERFGFTTTPRAIHPWGTANSLVQFQDNFLELLTVATPAQIPPATPGVFGFGAYNRDFLARREGFSMLVLASSDARADQRAFARAGLETYAPFDFSRQARLPDGSSATVSFSLAFVTDRRMPESVFFVCQQHAPQYFWKPEYQLHANGARGVVEVVMAADEPQRYGEFFARLQGADAVSVGDGMVHVAAGAGRIALMTPQRLSDRLRGTRIANAPSSPYFAGFSVAVADVERSAALLTARNVIFEQDGNSLRISPGQAFNVAIELVAG